MASPDAGAPSARATGGSGRLLFFVASAAVNMLNFVFHVVVSRSLGPADYSALGALLAILVIAAVPLSALQLASAQAQARAHPDAGIRDALRWSIVLAGVAGVFFVAGAPVFDLGLHLHGLVLPVLVGAWVALSTIAAVPQGVLVGAQRFREVAYATFLGSGVARVILGVVAGQAGAGVRGAMLATVLGQAITVVILIWPLRSRLGRGGEQLKPLASDGLLSVGALTGLAALAAVDTVVARNTLPTGEAGLYVAAATAGRISLFVPGAIALIVFPRFSAAAERGESGTELLWKSMAGVVALGLAAAGVISMVPGLVVRILFGHQYAGAVGTLPILALSGAALGALNLFSYFHIAHRSWAAQIPWAGALLILLGVGLRSQIEIRSLAYTMLGITVSCLLLSVSAALLTKPPGTEREVRMPALDLESGSLIPTAISRDVELG